jgi:uncharacterized protein with GYD domain
LEDKTMAYFLLQGAYSSESWKTLMKNPVNRTEAIRPIIEKLGGSVETSFFAFGEYDVLLIMQMPDNVTAASFAFAIAAGGAFKSHKTTPLLTWDEGIEGLRKASGIEYQPPHA